MSAKLELAAKVATGCTRAPVSVNSGTAAYYARKYTMAELRTFEAALTYADQYSRQARFLFDAAAWSERQRKHAGAKAERVLKVALTVADAEAWYAANFPTTPAAVAALADTFGGTIVEPADALPELGPIDKAAILAEPIDSLLNSGAETESTADAPIKVYLVVVDTIKGLMDVELIGTSSETAASRARWSLIHARQYGDVDQVQWVSVEEVVCHYFAACTNTATRFVEVLSDRVPTCQRCYDKAQSLRSGHSFDGMPACGKDVDGQGRRCNADPGHDGECMI